MGQYHAIKHVHKESLQRRRLEQEKNTWRKNGRILWAYSNKLWKTTRKRISLEQYIEVQQEKRWLTFQRKQCNSASKKRGGLINLELHRSSNTILPKKDEIKTFSCKLKLRESTARGAILGRNAKPSSSGPSRLIPVWKWVIWFYRKVWKVPEMVNEW